MAMDTGAFDTGAFDTGAFDTGDAALLVAGILLVASFAMTSMRWLRIIALVAGAAALFWAIVTGPGSLVVVLIAAFVIVNGGQLLMMILRTRQHHLSAEERELLEGVLQVQEPEQQRRLLGLMRWQDARPDDVLMQQGQARPPLIYLASGAAAIELDGAVVGVCGSGDFLGEMSMVTGETASATVRVTHAVRIARFDRDALAQFTATLPEMKRAFDAALNRGMAQKIARMNEAAAVSGN